MIRVHPDLNDTQPVSKPGNWKATAALVSLGCTKNLVDSEAMATQLMRLGYSMVGELHGASLILVNTCGFLETAVEEAIETILDVSRHKATGACRTLVVTGCMAQRYGRKLLDLLPEVDLFVGTSHLYRLEEILEAHRTDPGRRLFISRPRFLFDSGLRLGTSTPFYSAYVKIAEGCSNRCSFCMIPKLRGPYRSRPIPDILSEVRALARQGAKEINLIAQDTTAFGSDRGEPDALVKLLDQMEEVEGISWIRLLYAYPERIGKELLTAMSRSSKLVPYLDVPLQHCEPRILKAMGRFHGGLTPEALINRLRDYVPDISLRTSLMVGFPGETESDFERLLLFMERAQFDHLGVFEFSPERGVPASKFPGQIDQETKRLRRNVLLSRQQEIWTHRSRSMIGQRIAVLLEGFHPETDLLLCGRTAAQAPEVDGKVIITKGSGDPGEMVLAELTRIHGYDFEAEIVGSLDHRVNAGNPLLQLTRKEQQNEGKAPGLSKTL